MDDALAALERKDIKAARADAQAARDRNPLAVEPLFVRSVVEQQAGNAAGARRALEDAVKLQPSNSEPWLRLAGYALTVEHDPAQAEAALGPALYLDPRSRTGDQPVPAGHSARPRRSETRRHRRSDRAGRRRGAVGARLANAGVDVPGRQPPDLRAGRRGRAHDGPHEGAGRRPAAHHGAVERDRARAQRAGAARGLRRGRRRRVPQRRVGPLRHPGAAWPPSAGWA